MNYRLNFGRWRFIFKTGELWKKRHTVTEVSAQEIDPRLEVQSKMVQWWVSRTCYQLWSRCAQVNAFCQEEILTAQEAGPWKGRGTKVFHWAVCSQRVTFWVYYSGEWSLSPLSQVSTKKGSCFLSSDLSFSWYTLLNIFFWANETFCDLQGPK